MFSFLKKLNCVLLAILMFLPTIRLSSSEYTDVINKFFLNKKLDTIEGIWTKTIANEGPAGCVTMFYKDENDFYYQVHIDSCFVMGKVTGKQKKITENKYEGENAVYFFNGDVNWGASSIGISEDLNSFAITHNSFGNYFTEKWKRIWPEDIVAHNKKINN
ncbi:MAG: hypothetical protein CFH34_01369 [Alphaproteobacteria bacterium MarineAlpha9_Bin4]|nr:hypothetical protein [Pelagibacterales bacterium]PPR25606.1 MAG: hypothetical protein CFH34_01369 [Alphaproteobacteria bacterium MarineAlpha9_Bin4]|tara:strand:+ start:499 stop:981 length:483 start_codon:yes stop_codon:yes gene_type:complete